MKRPLIPRMVLMGVSVAVGFLLITQLRTQETLVQDVRNLTPDELVQLINTTADDNLKTRQEIAQLQFEIETFRRDQLQGRSSSDSLREELKRLQTLTGESPVTGPGIEIVIYYDLQVEHVHALLNEVRNASGEAIAINGQRVLAHTSIQRGPDGLLVAGSPITPPLHVEVIGQPATLMGALTRIGGLIRIWRDVAGVQSDVREVEELRLAPAAPRPAFVFAQPVDEP